jgi:hypothetical protein
MCAAAFGRALCVAGVMTCASAAVGAEASWPLPVEAVFDAEPMRSVPDAPSVSIVVPAPDGALAGLSLLAGLGVAYAIRHHRARRVTR